MDHSVLPLQSIIKPFEIKLRANYERGHSSWWLISGIRAYVWMVILLGLARCSSGSENRPAETSANEESKIVLVQGIEQTFRYRHEDINVLGSVEASPPYTHSTYQLNEGEHVYFYVKDTSRAEDRISRNRLGKTGDFNIEIPVSSSRLKEGSNQLSIHVMDGSGTSHHLAMRFSWNPNPLPLPLDLRDLSGVKDIQQVGQVVNGAFEIDTVQHLIRTKSPVGKDVLLLLGSAQGSQEATYSVRFADTTGRGFRGLSDFFAGHEAAKPDIGIKPGWSSAGLATIKPNQDVRIWLAWGDLLEDERKWVVRTEPPKAYAYTYTIGTTYRVRHQVLFEDGINKARFKIWPLGEQEPTSWLAEESDQAVADDKIRFTTASFGLFQYYGKPTEWFDIYIRSLE